MYVHARSESRNQSSEISEAKKLPTTNCQLQTLYPHLTISAAMEDAIAETYRRRAVQIAYNEKHGITPTTIISSIKDISIPKKKNEIFA